MTILLEQIQGQVQAVMEAVQASERRITEKFELRFQKIELRLDALEFAVRKNSEDIRKNGEDIQELRDEVRRLNEILRTGEDENAIVALERRVERLEHRIGA